VEKLKPCPFCGGEAVLAWKVPRKRILYWVVCNGCPARIDEGGKWSELEAIAIWNTRVGGE
jgi:Lar family restriction alleviation protein